ncbi:hypothetical protein ACNOYE_31715 [Nannocystaceae bacterium ST9]
MIHLTLGLLALVGLAACDVSSEELELLEAEAALEQEGNPVAAGDEIALDTEPYSGNNYYVPVGTHDSATCSTIAGWVKDGDTTASTWATIHADGPYPYGTPVATATANLYRGDLPFADKNHGFSVATPNWLKDNEWHTIYVHGINVDAGGQWDVNAYSPLLNLTAKDICCPGPCLDDPPEHPDLP